MKSPLDDLVASGAETADAVNRQITNPPLPGELPSQQVQREAQEGIVEDRRNRIKASQLAARGLAPYQNPETGAVAPVTDQTGVPITQFDSNNNIGYDAAGAPVEVSFDPYGNPKTKDPFADLPALTDDKTGDIYKVRKGLPWQWQGRDERIAEARRLEDEQKQLAQTSSALGRKLSLDEHAEKTALAQHDKLAEDLAAKIPVIAGEGSREDKERLLNEHFDSELKGATKTDGFLGFGGNPTEDSIRQQQDIEARRKEALGTLNQIYTIQDEIRARRDAIAESQGQAVSIAEQRLKGSLQAAGMDLPEDTLRQQAKSQVGPTTLDLGEGEGSVIPIQKTPGQVAAQQRLDSLRQQGVDVPGSVRDLPKNPTTGEPVVPSNIIPGRDEAGNPLPDGEYAGAARAMEKIEQVPLDFWDKWKDVSQDNPEQLLPYVGSAKEIIELGSVGVAAYKLRSGEADQEDLALLKEFVERNSRDTTFMYKVGAVVAALPAFAGELLTTGGTYTAGSRVGIKIAKEGMEWLATKAGKELLETAAAKFAVKGAGAITGSALQTLPASALRISAETMTRMLPEMEVAENDLGQLEGVITAEGDDLIPALTKSFGNQYVQVMSERTGGALAFIPGAKKLEALKLGLMKKWFDVNPKATPGMFASLVKQAGWHGVIGEMFEERVGEVAGGAIALAAGDKENRDFGATGSLLRGDPAAALEQLAVEGVSFMVPGALGSGVGVVGAKKAEKRTASVAQAYQQEGKVFDSVNTLEGISPEQADQAEKLRFTAQTRQQALALPLVSRHKSAIDDTLEEVDFWGKQDHTGAKAFLTTPGQHVFVAQEVGSGLRNDTGAAPLFEQIESKLSEDGITNEVQRQAMANQMVGSMALARTIDEVAKGNPVTDKATLQMLRTAGVVTSGTNDKGEMQLEVDARALQMLPKSIAEKYADDLANLNISNRMERGAIEPMQAMSEAGRVKIGEVAAALSPLAEEVQTPGTEEGADPGGEFSDPPVEQPPQAPEGEPPVEQPPITPEPPVTPEGQPPVPPVTPEPPITPEGEPPVVTPEPPIAPEGEPPVPGEQPPPVTPEPPVVPPTDQPPPGEPPVAPPAPEPQPPGQPPAAPEGEPPVAPPGQPPVTPPAPEPQPPGPETKGQPGGEPPAQPPAAPPEGQPPTGGPVTPPGGQTPPKAPKARRPIPKIPDIPEIDDLFGAGPRPSGGVQGIAPQSAEPPVDYNTPEFKSKLAKIGVKVYQSGVTEPADFAGVIYDQLLRNKGKADADKLTGSMLGIAWLEVQDQNPDAVDFSRTEFNAILAELRDSNEEAPPGEPPIAPPEGEPPVAPPEGEPPAPPEGEPPVAPPEGKPPEGEPPVTPPEGKPPEGEPPVAPPEGEPPAPPEEKPLFPHQWGELPEDGDRVVVSGEWPELRQNKSLYGLSQLTGTVVRARNGKITVDFDPNDNGQSFPDIEVPAEFVAPYDQDTYPFPRDTKTLKEIDDYYESELKVITEIATRNGIGFAPVDPKEQSDAYYWGFDRAIHLNKAALLARANMTNTDSQTPLKFIQAVLWEELGHALEHKAAGFDSAKMAQNDELVWRELVKNNPSRAVMIASTYSSAKSDSYLGAEYVRMVFQQQVLGFPTGHTEKLPSTPTLLRIMRKILAFLKNAIKPSNLRTQPILEMVVARMTSLVRQPGELRKITDKWDYAEAIKERILAGEKLTNVDARKMREHSNVDFKDDKEMDEFIELGAVRAMRVIAADTSVSVEETYDRLVEIYQSQPVLNNRTSDSSIRQAFSTPPPLAYYASRMANLKDKNGIVGEMTAGNSALLVELNPRTQLYRVNEIDPERRARLEYLGFEATGFDALMEKVFNGDLDTLLLNPPFGTQKDSMNVSKPFTITEGEYTLTTTRQDHYLALKALQEGLKDDGRAVLILGSVGATTDEGRKIDYGGKQFAEFHFMLSRLYNIVEHITVDGALYNRMGAAWPVDVITIQGRKPSTKYSLPSFKPPTMVTSWDELRERLAEYEHPTKKPDKPSGGSSGGQPGGGSDGSIRRPPSRPQPDGKDGGSGGNPDGDTSQPPESGNGGKNPQIPPTTPDGTPPVEPDAEAKGGIPERDSGRDADATGQPVSGFQTPYTPLSKAKKPDGMLTPTELKTPQERALATLEEDVGDIDAFVARELGYDLGKVVLDDFKGKKIGIDSFKQVRELGAEHTWNEGDIVLEFRDGKLIEASRIDDVEEFLNAPRSSIRFMVGIETGIMDDAALMSSGAPSFDDPNATYYVVSDRTKNDPKKLLAQHFLAEQVDSIALAIWNHDRGHSVIVGHQTGIGKGRIAAGLMKWARLRGMIPVFVTQNEGLYMEMFKDIDDIGDHANVTPFFTNLALNQGAGLYDVTGSLWKPRRSRQLAHYNTIVSTGELPMMDVVEAVDTSTIVDEVVEETSDAPTEEGGAGVQSVGKKGKKGKKKGKPTEQTQTTQRRANVVFTTYSQFNGRPGLPRQDVLSAIGEKAFLVLDESHGAAGDSQVGAFMVGLLGNVAGAYYSSATFSKTPASMGLYHRTTMAASGASPDEIIATMKDGGLPMQQVISEMLGKDGVLTRLERDFGTVRFHDQEGTENKDRDYEAARNFSGITKKIGRYDVAARQQMRTLHNWLGQFGITVVAGTKPQSAKMASKVPFANLYYNLVNTYVLALKADSIVKETIERVKSGTPVPTDPKELEKYNADLEKDNKRIAVLEALSNLTPAEAMELDTLKRRREGQKIIIQIDLTGEAGLQDMAGSGADADFREILQRYLRNCARFNLKLPLGLGEVEGNLLQQQSAPDITPLLIRAGRDPGQVTKAVEEWQTLWNNAQRNLQPEHMEVNHTIEKANLGDFAVSPIDYIQDKLAEAGIASGDYTGRGTAVKEGKIVSKHKNTRGDMDALKKRFNNNDDFNVLILNRSGAVGISLHSSVTVESHKQRVMLLAQPSPDIAVFMQTLGRIFRTGQVNSPEYVFLRTALPAEYRLGIMLRRKIASLNANTTSNTESDVSSEMEAYDMFNEYGDRAVYEFFKADLIDSFRNHKTPVMAELPELFSDASQAELDRVFGAYMGTGGAFTSKITGAMGVIDPYVAETFYDGVIERFTSTIKALQNDGIDPFSTAALDYKAEPLGAAVQFTGAVGDSTSEFAQPSFIQKMRFKSGKEPEDVFEVYKEASANRRRIEGQWGRLVARGDFSLWDIQGVATDPSDELLPEEKDDTVYTWGQSDPAKGKDGKWWVPILENAKNIKKPTLEDYRRVLDATAAEHLDRRGKAMTKQTRQGLEQKVERAWRMAQTAVRFMYSSDIYAKQQWIYHAGTGADAAGAGGETALAIITDVHFNLEKPLAPSESYVVLKTNNSKHHTKRLQLTMMEDRLSAYHASTEYDTGRSFAYNWEETKTVETERFVITGNLFNGFREMRALGVRGSIVRFTQKEGPELVAIELPSTFTGVSEEIIKTPERFIEKVLLEGVTATIAEIKGDKTGFTGTLSYNSNYDQVYFEVDTDKSGKLNTNPAMIALTEGGNGFYTRRGRGYRSTYIDRARVAEFFNFITGAPFNAQIKVPVVTTGNAQPLGTTSASNPAVQRMLGIQSNAPLSERNQKQIEWMKPRATKMLGYEVKDPLGELLRNKFDAFVALAKQFDKEVSPKEGKQAVAPQGVAPAPEVLKVSRKEVNTKPTEAQKEAGNYKKGHVTLSGLDITIENPNGTQRTGTSKAGKQWSVTMFGDYGYIKGSEGQDKDHVDVFIAPGTPVDFDGPVFIINQINPQTNQFDEHKVIIGAKTEDEARAIYLKNYSPGWKGLASVGGMYWGDFAQWARGGGAKAGPAPMLIPFGESTSPMADATHPVVSRHATDPITGEGGDGEISEFEMIERQPVVVSEQPTAEFKGRRIGRREIVRQLSAVLEAAGRNLPFRVGRMRGRKDVTGVFKEMPEVVRLREALSLDVAAHELGHALQKLVYKTMKAGALKSLPSAVKQELLKLGKNLYGSKQPLASYTVEGFAEFVRIYLTQDNAALVAPATHDFFINTVMSVYPKAREQLLIAKDLFDQYRAQGIENATAAKMVDPLKVRTRLQKFMSIFNRDELFKNWIEEFKPIRDLSEQASELLKRAGRGKLDIENDPYLIASVRRGQEGHVARHMVEKGMMDFNGNPAGASLKEALAPVENQMEQFTLFLWAHRAMERLGFDIDKDTKEWVRATDENGVPKPSRNPGMTEEDARFLIAELGKNPKFNIAAQKVWEWNAGVMNYVRQASPSMATMLDRIESSSKFYVPLRRFFEDDEIQTAKAHLNAKSGNPLQNFRGSGRDIIDPIPALLQHTERLVALAHKRQVMDAIIRLSSISGLGFRVEEVPRGMVRNSLTIGQIKKQLEQLGLDSDQLDQVEEDALLNFFSPALIPKGNDPIISYTQNGKTKWYFVEPRLYDALQGLEVYRLPKIADFFLGMPARLFRLGTTGLRASFSLFTNPVRDLPTFLMQTQSRENNPGTMLGHWASSLAALVNPMRLTGVEDKWISQFDRFGVQVGQPLGVDMQIAATSHRRMYHGMTEKIVNHPIEMLRELLSVTEAAPRIAEMKLMAKEVGWDGESPLSQRQALAMSLAAKRVTVDFMAAGAVAKKVNQVMPFFNASVQGMRLFARALKENPSRAAMMGFSVLTIPTLLLWYMNKDEDWYNDLPWADRFLFFNVRVGNQLLKIPRPFEYGNFFSAVPEAIFDSFYKQDPESAKAVFNHIIKTSNPTSLPPLLNAWYQDAANKVEFFDRPIVPQQELKLYPGEQRGPYTSDLSKFLGDVFPKTVSPRRLDAAIYALTGGALGDYTRDMETMGKALGLMPSTRELEPSDIPVFGRAFARGGVESGRSLAIDKFFTAWEEANRRQKSRMFPETPADEQRRKRLADAYKAIKVLNASARMARTMEQRQLINARIRDVAQSALERAPKASSISAMPYSQAPKKTTDNRVMFTGFN
jgi:hypothetical protein